MACADGYPLQLGVKSSLFPTVYVDERSGRRVGINVEILETLGRLEKCDGAAYTEYSSEGEHWQSFRSLSSDESYCEEDHCVNALSKAVLNGSVFADVDSIQLTSSDIALYRYSLPVDVPRLVMLEGRPATVKEIAMDLRSYTVYNVDSAALLILLLMFRMVLRVLRSRLASHSEHNSGWVRTLIAFIDFISKLFHVISIFLIVLFYQCYFAGNVLVEQVQKEEFVSVIADLMNGTRRLLIDTGVLMENEYTAFGPRTTVMINEQERLERLCNEEDDVVLLWDDQLFGLAKFNQELVKNCRINRVDIPTEINNHPVPRLEKSLEVGEPLYFLMPRSTRRKTVERINQILTTIFTHDLRNSLHVRRYIPARTHGAAFDAYRATFPSDAKFPAFLETSKAQRSQWLRATSLIHLLYPLIALCVGLFLSIIVFLIELLIKHQRERIERNTLPLRKLTLIKQISNA